MPSAQPTVTVTPKGARRLRSGIPWVFRGDVAEAEEARSGAIVTVADQRGNHIGQAFWAARSPLALRLLTRGRERVDTGFFRERIRASLERRVALFPNDDAYRVVHGEADLLPGLFVDRYADGLTVQLISEGMEARRAEIVAVLDELLKPRLVAVRNDTATSRGSSATARSTGARGRRRSPTARGRTSSRST